MSDDKPKVPAPRKPWYRRPLTRDGFLLAFGTVGILFEMFGTHGHPDPTLVMLFGGFCLGVGFLPSGDKHREKRREDDV